MEQSTGLILLYLEVDPLTELETVTQTSIYRQRYGKVYTSYFAIENRVRRRLPDIQQYIAPVRYLPHWIERERYRWLIDLSPSTVLLNQVKSGEINFEEYSKRYLAEITSNFDSMKLINELIDCLVFKKMDLVLFCYEKDSTQCHRNILKTLLVEVSGGRVGVEPFVFDGGEIS